MIIFILFCFILYFIYKILVKPKNIKIDKSPLQNNLLKTVNKMIIHKTTTINRDLLNKNKTGNRKLS